MAKIFVDKRLFGGENNKKVITESEDLPGCLGSVYIEISTLLYRNIYIMACSPISWSMKIKNEGQLMFFKRKHESAITLVTNIHLDNMFSISHRDIYVSIGPDNLKNTISISTCKLHETEYEMVYDTGEMNIE